MAVYPFEARAWVDETPVAATSQALQVERPGATPMLCFPVQDVRGKPPADVSLSAPDGYVAFDCENPRVRVMIVDGLRGEPERDHTLKRFPTWGDAADLIDVLNVRPDGDRSYVSVVHDSPANRHRGVVEGSQMLAQAIVAAGRHAPRRRVVSASMVFMRAASTSEPLRIQLDELSGGRNFTTLAPRVLQSGKLCASGIMLLDATAPDVIRHAAAAPDTSGPYESQPFDMSVTGRDIRFVDGAYTGDPNAPVGPPLVDAWLKFRQVPEDPCLHAGLLAQFSGHVSIAAALRPHKGIGQSQAHRTLSTAINAIHISFHADVRADKWLLYRHRSTFAGDGMTHSECRVYNVERELLASFSVDAMVRRFSNDRAVDERTSL
ncbi:MAG TPA: acyl-CoA thioesterase domain-containing protein [Polyangiales bacterium]|nr:acyl-CoA thioesterase domain-containing protein [Polyangiales bacterium]